jgi:hypothetical protein
MAVIRAAAPRIRPASGANKYRGVTLTPAQIASVIRMTQWKTTLSEDNPWNDEGPATDPRLGGGVGKHSKLVIAVAIALAESRGKLDAVNQSRNGIAVGLFQIYTRGATRVDTRLFDPVYNTQRAIEKYRAQGWGAWSAFTSGAYRQFIPQATAGVKATHKDSVFEKAGDVVGGVVDAATGTFNVLTSASTWARVGFVLGGGVIVLLGILFVYQQAKSSTVGKAVRTAAKTVGG